MPFRLGYVAGSNHNFTRRNGLPYRVQIGIGAVIPLAVSIAMVFIALFCSDTIAV